MSLFIRYTDLHHGDDLIQDYVNMGKYFHYPDISAEGIQKIKGITFDAKYRKIYTCPSLPCLKTAELIADNHHMEIIIDDDLRNIRHDFSTLYHENITQARENFYCNFIEDRLLEKKIDIINRIQRIIQSAQNHDYIIITHGILLSLIRLEVTYGLHRITLKDILKYVDMNKEIASSGDFFEL